MKKKILLFLVLILSLSSLCLLFSFAASATGVLEPTVSIDRFNLVFGDNVYLKYAVKFENVDHAEITEDNVGMLYFTEPQEEYVEGNESFSSSVVGYVNINGEIYYTFEYRNLTAKQMTDYIYSVAYIDINDVRYYSEPAKYSVLDYA